MYSAGHGQNGHGHPILSGKVDFLFGSIHCFFHAVLRIYCIEPSCSRLTTLQLTNCLYLKYCTIYRRYERHPQSGNAICALRPFTIVEVEDFSKSQGKRQGESVFRKENSLFLEHIWLDPVICLPWQQLRNQGPLLCDERTDTGTFTSAPFCLISNWGA